MRAVVFLFVVFFFQAEDGIRDHCVTGVQTCALPISKKGCREMDFTGKPMNTKPFIGLPVKSISRHPFFVNASSYTSGSIRAIRSSLRKIGRASCRERV